MVVAVVVVRRWAVLVNRTIPPWMRRRENKRGKQDWRGKCRLTNQLEKFEQVRNFIEA